jgi:Tfp pilus assembly protein PilF
MRVAVVLLAVLLQACRSAPAPSPAANARDASGAPDAFERAYAAMREGRALDALPLYEEAIADAPDHEGAWVEYAICLRRLGRLAAAARAGWRALELGAPSSGKWANLGNVFMQAQAFDAARAAFDEAARLADDRAWAARNFLNLGYREWAALHFGAAAADYRRAARMDPRSPLPAVDLAMLLASDRDPAVVARARTDLEGIRDLLGRDDEQTAAYVDAALREIRDKGALTPPHFPDASGQELPSELLTRPPAGVAARVTLPARGWRTYRLARDVSARLHVPEGWSEQVKTDDPRVVTILFQPSAGSPRKMLASMIVVPLHPARDDVREFVENQMKRLLPSAVERAPPLVDVSSPGARGFAFSVTDREALKRPTPDDVPYLTQGRLVGRRVDVVFSFFALEDREAERTEALDVLRGMEEAP